jgi:site-specific DNA-methyltransferase (adenine-specific)
MAVTIAEVPGPTSVARFLHGDGVEVLADLDPFSVDVIVTSPPYNIGIEYGSYHDTLTPSAYLDWTDQWLGAASRALAPEGSLFLNVGSRPLEPWIALDVAQVARQHLQLQNAIHWIKSIAIDRDASPLDRDVSVGHYKPIRSDRFLNDCHEYIFHFTPRGATPVDRMAIGVPYQDPSNAERWQRACGRRCRGNTWFMPYDTIHTGRDRPHPATFPLKLPERCLRLHGLEHIRLVVDPFVGIGTTALAALRLDLNVIGVDIDATYLREAVARARKVAA